MHVKLIYAYYLTHTCFAAKLAARLDRSQQNIQPPTRTILTMTRKRKQQLCLILLTTLSLQLHAQSFEVTQLGTNNSLSGNLGSSDWQLRVSGPFFAPVNCLPTGQCFEITIKTRTANSSEQKPQDYIKVVRSVATMTTCKKTTGCVVEGGPNGLVDSRPLPVHNTTIRNFQNYDELAMWMLSLSPSSLLPLVNLDPTTLTFRKNYGSYDIINQPENKSRLTVRPSCLHMEFGFNIGYAPATGMRGQSFGIVEGEYSMCLNHETSSPITKCNGDVEPIRLGTVPPGPITASSTLRLTCSGLSFPTVVFDDGGSSRQLILPGGELAVTLPQFRSCDPTCSGSVMVNGTARTTGSLSTSVPLVLTYW